MGIDSSPPPKPPDQLPQQPPADKKPVVDNQADKAKPSQPSGFDQYLANQAPKDSPAGRQQDGVPTKTPYSSVTADHYVDKNLNDVYVFPDDRLNANPAGKPNDQAKAPGTVTEETQVKKVNQQTGKLETIAEEKHTIIPEVTVVGHPTKEKDGSGSTEPQHKETSAEAASGTVKADAGKTPAAETHGEEGLESFTEKLLLGDYSDNTTWSGMAGQVIGGFIPGWAEIADARDIAHAVGEVIDGKEGGWTDLAINTIAIVPGLDALKGIGKVGEGVVKNADEIGKVAKHADEAVHLAKGTEVAENAAKHVDMAAGATKASEGVTGKRGVAGESVHPADPRWDPKNTFSPDMKSSVPLRESAGASPKGPEFQSASARTNRSVYTGPRADMGEAAAYKRACDPGGLNEIGLERPQGTNVAGRADFITAREGADGKYVIVANDAKTVTSDRGRFPTPASSMPDAWKAQIGDAVGKDRLNLGDPVLEGKIREAYEQGRIEVRQINVDYRTQRIDLGGGTVEAAAPRPRGRSTGADSTRGTDNVDVLRRGSKNAADRQVPIRTGGRSSAEQQPKAPSLEARLTDTTKLAEQRIACIEKIQGSRLSSAERDTVREIVDRYEAAKRYADPTTRTDFSGHLYQPKPGSNERAVVDIGLLRGDRKADERAANKLANLTRTPDGYTWHHSEHLGQMELVEESAHKEYPHCGMVSLWKAAGGWGRYE